MKHRNKIVIALGTVFTAGILLGGCGMHKKHMSHDRHGIPIEGFSPKVMRSAMHKIDLTSEQKEAFKSLRQLMHENRRKHETKDLKKVSTFMTAEALDTKALKAFIKSKSAEHIDLRVGFIEKAYNVLTQAQRQVFIDEIAKCAKED